MHEGYGRLDLGVVEVQVELGELPGHEHALVHDGARAHGADVEDGALRQAKRVRALLHGASGHVQGALEVVARRHPVRTQHERLPDARLALAGRHAQVVRVNRHLAPEEHGQPRLAAHLLEQGPGLLEELLLARQEQHGHAVVALVGQKAPALLRLLAEEAVRRLEQDARAVARVALEAHAAAVVEVEEDGERVVEHLVAAHALDVGERADAARVVVELRPVEAVWLVVVGACLRAHLVVLHLPYLLHVSTHLRAVGSGADPRRQ